MERLTEYEKIAGNFHVIPIVSDMDAIMMRLAAYVDAGLTPGEVRCLWGEWRAMMRVLNSIGSYDRLVSWQRPTRRDAWPCFRVKSAARC